MVRLYMLVENPCGKSETLFFILTSAEAWEVAFALDLDEKNRCSRVKIEVHLSNHKVS